VGERSPHLYVKQGKFVAANMKFSRIFLFSLRFPYWQRTNRRIAGPTVLAQHKENKTIGEARKTICSTSPIVIEIAL
jgi:hypothetical protein